jgi:AbrB family looped-hinge helix DNA binding protein
MKEASGGKGGLSRVGRGKVYGSTTLGERGQIVIPAEARKDFGFEVGQKLIVMSHGRGVLVLNADVVAQMVAEDMDRLALLERRLAEETSDVK